MTLNLHTARAVNGEKVSFTMKQVDVTEAQQL